MDSKLQKEAAQAIRTLQNSVDELTGELEQIKTAEELVLKLVKAGKLSVEMIESTLTELKAKSKEELEVIKKASELSPNADSGELFGRLSDRPADDGSLDPLTRLLLEDI